MDLQQTIVTLFDTHPTVDVFYMTSDNQFFTTQANADFQASRLPKKGVATVTRGISEQLKEALANNAGIAHDEQSTALTPEQLVAKQADDDTAQDNLTKALSTQVEGTASATKTALQIALETPEANRTPTQKGLVTKANNAAVNVPAPPAPAPQAPASVPAPPAPAPQAPASAPAPPAPASNADNTNTDTNTQV